MAVAPPPAARLPPDARDGIVRESLLLAPFPSESPMPHNPVIWFELYVRDLPRAQAFYEAVLRRPLSPLGPAGPEMLAFEDLPGADGTAGALVRAPDGMPVGGGGTVVYFACDDCAVEAARVAPAGGTLVREKMSIGPFGFVALAQDPDGNLFGLHSMV